jgi:hypothetical protein
MDATATVTMVAPNEGAGHRKEFPNEPWWMPVADFIRSRAEYVLGICHPEPAASRATRRNARQ